MRSTCNSMMPFHYLRHCWTTTYQPFPGPCHHPAPAAHHHPAIPRTPCRRIAFPHSEKGQLGGGGVMSDFTRCDSPTHTTGKRETHAISCVSLPIVTGPMFQTVWGARSCEIHSFSEIRSCSFIPSFFLPTTYLRSWLTPA